MTTIKVGAKTINTDHIVETSWSEEDGELTVRTLGYSLGFNGAQAQALHAYLIRDAVDVMTLALDDEPSRDLIGIARAAADLIDDGDLNAANEMLSVLARGRAILPRSFKEAAQRLAGEVLYTQDLNRAQVMADRLLNLMEERND